jgi:DNA-binding FrmR family transcriptional regulator
MNPPRIPGTARTHGDFCASQFLDGLYTIVGYIISKAERTVMGHTVREKTKLLQRIRRIRGQIEAIERALESEAGCSQTLQLIAAARGAMSGLMAKVVDEHLQAHILGARSDSDRERAAGELGDVVRTYLR